MIYDSEKAEVLQVLCGSESRVVCIQWHPQLEYILAAGSFDNIVRVHDTKFVSLIFLSDPITFQYTDNFLELDWLQRISVP